MSSNNTGNGADTSGGILAPVQAAASVQSSLAGWATHPFSTQMSLSGWALFVGLIIVLTIIWMMILRDLRGEV